MDFEWTLFFVAALVGGLVGITGVGAGAIMTPLLVAVFGIPVPIAVATDLVFATITKTVGVFLHNRTGNINWKAARRLWSGSIPGAILGAGIVILFATQALGQLLLWPLVLLVLATAVALGKRALFPASTPSLQTSQDYVAKGMRTHRMAPIGAFGIGLAVALTSVGAGALGMALLVKLSPPHTRPQHLVGTDLVHAIPIAFIAGAAYSFAGLISLPLLGTLLLGSIPGVAAGSFFANHIPARPINLAIAMVLVVAAILTAVGAA